MKVVISDAYSPTNIGDGELVRLTINSVRSRYSNEPVVLCTDRLGFEADPTFRGSKFIYKPLSRVLWRDLGGMRKLSLLCRDASGILAGLIVSQLPIPTGSKSRILERVGQLLQVRWLEEVATADVVVGVGGGYIGDKYLRESLMTLAVFRVGVSAGAQVETMPLSISSANRPILKQALKFFGRSVAWRSRERTTHGILDSLGLTTECVPDLAWLNAFNNIDVRPTRALVLAPLGSDFYTRGATTEPKIWPYIRDVVQQLVPGDQVSLVAMHYWDERLQDGRDDRECERVAELIRHENPKLMVEVLELRTYEEVLSVMATSRLAVCERLHAALAALAVGTPTKVVGYEPKHRGVLELAELHVLVDESVPYVRERVSGDHIATAGSGQAALTHTAVMGS